MTETMIGLGVLTALCFLRVPIAIAMGLVGMAGVVYMRDGNWLIGFNVVQTKIYETGRNYHFSVVPLFILMGSFVTRAGMSQELFRAANAFVGHLRGGLAMSAIVACAGFGAICGSSIATAATMAKVSYPAMRKVGYKQGLAAASVCAGGTLGILIPPSTVLVLYGILTETSIGKLFAAGIIPGLIATLFLCLAVQWVVWRDPEAGPRGVKATWGERIAAVQGVWGVGLLFAIVMGGIYGGFFTATEGAGVGAFGALVFALARRALTWSSLLDCLVEAARTTAMLFAILTGAFVFTEFINYTSMPDDLKRMVTGLSPYTVIAIITVMYLVLGMVMEELSMVLLTVPVLFPLITHLGFDPIWFGIYIVVVVEIGMISPPVGMNLFVVLALLKDVSTGTLYRGIIPFCVADVLRLIVLIAFPALSLWLPGFMR
jgi:C4-dicarboxylate transporter, DctM subunit